MSVSVTTISTLFSLALGAIKALNAFFAWMEANKQFSAGQKDIVAKQLTETMKIIGRAKEISNEVDKMSSDDVDAKLNDLSKRV